MVLLVSEQLTAGQVDESTGKGDQDGEPRLELLLVGLERQSAVTEHGTARLDIADCVHARVDLELADALVRRLHGVLRLIGSVLLELRREAHA